MRLGVIEATGRRWGRPVAWVVGSLLVIGPRPVAPATITVGGPCELAEAIDSANQDMAVGGCASGSGADTLQLTGNVTLMAVDNSTDGDNGLPSIITEITIDGAGNTIERDGGAPSFRIFHIASGGDLTLEDVTVSGGRVEGMAASGGGLFNRGRLALANSTISGNAVVTDEYGYGGGIYNLGTLELESSAVTWNQVDSELAYGGGISNGSFAYQSAALTAELSDVSGNAVVGYVVGGGGVENWGFATLTRSTVAGNTGEPSGGFFPTLTGAGISLVAGSMTLSSSTVSGNSGSSDNLMYSLLFGGGVFVDDGLLSASASTISTNTLSATGVYGIAYGGGVNHRDPMGTMSFSTLSGNSVSANYQQGGALFVSSGAGLSLIGSVIADSAGGNCAGAGTINDIQSNLADDASCGTVPSTLAGLDPTLLDNGGPTETHALLPGSTAIDHAGECFIPTDQRGVERDDLGGCDSGSFELNECLAPDGNQAIAEGVIGTQVSIEVCQRITTGESLIVAFGGDLILRSGARVALGDGTVVEDGGQLTIEIDPGLQM